MPVSHFQKTWARSLDPQMIEESTVFLRRNLTLFWGLLSSWLPDVAVELLYRFAPTEVRAAILGPQLQYRQ
jgi:hypothetical protein